MLIPTTINWANIALTCVLITDSLYPQKPATKVIELSDTQEDTDAISDEDEVEPPKKAPKVIKTEKRARDTKMDAPRGGKTAGRGGKRRRV